MTESQFILIVDDEYAIRDVVTRILSYSGLRAVSVESAEKAIDMLALASQEVALLLTDFQMPGMQGDQLITHVRIRYPHLRIILMTGVAANPQYDTLFRSLGVAILAKPFGERQLVTLVQTVLDDGAARREERSWLQ